ncbi:hypothetical protein SAMN02910384_00885 [Pseudobutyrivibrio sp. ACV-2]|nr:hypothetical protein [Pseudobutyrivibrio sp. ACV-2]SEA10926.1 hypothetical protein SAMN02910384_00885 [Pseudobutyrivibrio sp. ACV-2]
MELIEQMIKIYISLHYDEVINMLDLGDKKEWVLKFSLAEFET